MTRVPLVLALGLASTYAVGAAGGGAGSPGPSGEAHAGSAPVEVATAPRRPLPFFYDLFTFRGESGLTDVVAAFAVPAGRLRRERGDFVRYRFDVTLVLADTALQAVSRTDDSVYVRVPRPLSGDHLLYTQVEVQAEPSSSVVHRVIMTDAARSGVGQLYGSPFTIPDYRGDTLMISDIALGQPDAQGGWSRGGVTLALLPTSQLPESAFDVYYEIYNLPLGTPYATEIAIEPVDEFGEDLDEEGFEVRTRFSGESGAREETPLVELRRVESSLPRGHYRLTVTVFDELTGASASNARLLQVRGWRRGATMVPALPAERIGSGEAAARPE